MEKKCIIVGVSGGIAAYKSAQLVSNLKKKGHDVHVLMTKSAQQFVGVSTFQTLSGNKVITDIFSLEEVDVPHISLAKKADVFVVAPASANTIAKLAHGLADDMLSTTFLAATCPKVIVPAMNTHMLENPITQDNLKTLENYGIHILQSGEGYLACGDVGKGRMPEVDEIEDALEMFLETNQFLKDKNILISAGPTQEAIDPVRYITNHSSGKMGYALAKAARNYGANVTLVHGKTNLKDLAGVDNIEITSAEDMKNAIIDQASKQDVIIMAAAIADYTPKEVANQKMKKGDDDLNIELKRTTDILATLGKEKKDGQCLIGFAMETEDLIDNAKKKLESKNCDYIIANTIGSNQTGFAVDTNQVTILSKEEDKALPLLSKEETAEEILKYCLEGK